MNTSKQFEWTFAPTTEGVTAEGTVIHSAVL